MSTTSPSSPRKITIHTLQAKKERGEPITMLTAYDFPTARALDRAGVDSILVGDSLGMVVLGYENTLAVTMEDMLHHTRAIADPALVDLVRVGRVIADGTSKFLDCHRSTHHSEPADSRSKVLF